MFKQQFVTFAGDTYYPIGGWHDFIGCADTVKEAIQLGGRGNWAHIVDLSTGKIVAHRNVHCDWSIDQ